MFIIQNRDGHFYTGVNFTANKEKAVRFQTKQEAEKRIRIRSDLVVVPYEQPNYSFESIDADSGKVDQGS